MSKDSTSKQTVDFGRGESSDMLLCIAKTGNNTIFPVNTFLQSSNTDLSGSGNSKTYLNSAYLSVDRDSLDKHFSQLPAHQDREDKSLPESEGEKITNDLPRLVSTNNYSSMHRNLCNLLCTTHRAPQSLTDLQATGADNPEGN